ncbi:TetR family transcriptional regulator [Streptomyces phaeochromogenes]|uniref:TetR family transcriptional regulator n=1 Tax=Streptomyces phaeochromogenes TaxID=1923 RepID=UPI0036ADE0BD
MTGREVAREGLRERKRRETRRRIADVGMRLFLTNGFDATTLDMIAAAADVSRRTFFSYFDSKDDVLETWETGLEDALRAAVTEQPPLPAPLAVVRQALTRLATRYETDEALAIDRLMRSTETLLARKKANYERQEQIIVDALAERWPSPDRQHALRLIAMVGVGTLRLAIEAWSAEEHRGPLVDHLNEAFETVQSEMAP